METQRSGPVSLLEAKTSLPENGLERQVLTYGRQMMLVRHVMRAGWKGARHSHPHEQLVYVVRGRMRFVRNNEEFEATAGDSFIVPGGVEHQATALEDSEALDVFAPCLEDYIGEGL